MSIALYLFGAGVKFEVTSFSTTKVVRSSTCLGHPITRIPWVLSKAFSFRYTKGDGVHFSGDFPFLKISSMKEIFAALDVLYVTWGIVLVQSIDVLYLFGPGTKAVILGTLSLKVYLLALPCLKAFCFGLMIRFRGL